MRVIPLALPLLLLTGCIDFPAELLKDAAVALDGSVDQAGEGQPDLARPDAVWPDLKPPQDWGAPACTQWDHWTCGPAGAACYDGQGKRTIACSWSLALKWDCTCQVGTGSAVNCPADIAGLVSDDKCVVAHKAFDQPCCHP